MKRSMILAASASFLALNMSANADLQTAVKKGHFTTGVGLVVSDLPVAVAGLRLPITTLAYERSFMDPDKKIHSSAELGLLWFYGILPFPELSANLYFGSEKQDIQGKFGLGGFYDIAIGGHAGLMTKIGVVLKNRFDISFLIVPTGSDSKQSYQEFFGIDTPEEAQKFYEENGQHVIMPYYGMLFTVRY